MGLTGRRAAAPPGAASSRACVESGGVAQPEALTPAKRNADNAQVKNQNAHVWPMAWRTTAVLVMLAMAASMVPDQASATGVLLYLVPVALSVALCVVAVARIPAR